MNKYNSLRVVELKNKCREIGLSSGGRKDDLVRRLELHDDLNYLHPEYCDKSTAELKEMLLKYSVNKLSLRGMCKNDIILRITSILKSRLFPTGIIEIDVMVMANLDNKSLSSIFLTSRSLQKFANDSSFWKLRFCHKSGYEYNGRETLALDYKFSCNLITSNRRWQLLHEIIETTDSTNLFKHILTITPNVEEHYSNLLLSAVKNARIQILKMILEIKMPVDLHNVRFNAILRAVDLENIEVIRILLLYLDPKYISFECVYSAIKSDRIDILQLFNVTAPNIVAHKSILISVSSSQAMRTYLEEKCKIV